MLVSNKTALAPHFSAAIQIENTTMNDMKAVLQPGVEVIAEDGGIILKNNGNLLFLKAGTSRQAAEDIVKDANRNNIHIVSIEDTKTGFALSQMQRKIFECFLAMKSYFSRGELTKPNGILRNFSSVLERLCTKENSTNNNFQQIEAEQTIVYTELNEDGEPRNGSYIVNRVG